MNVSLEWTIPWKIDCLSSYGKYVTKFLKKFLKITYFQFHLFLGTMVVNRIFN